MMAFTSKFLLRAALQLKNPNALYTLGPRNLLGYVAFVVMPDGTVIPPNEEAKDHWKMLHQRGYNEDVEEAFARFFADGGLRIAVETGRTLVEFRERGVPLLLSLLEHVATAEVSVEDVRTGFYDSDAPKVVRAKVRRTYGV